MPSGWITRNLFYHLVKFGQFCQMVASQLLQSTLEIGITIQEIIFVLSRELKNTTLVRHQIHYQENL